MKLYHWFAVGNHHQVIKMRIFEGNHLILDVRLIIQEMFFNATLTNEET